MARTTNIRSIDIIVFTTNIRPPVALADLKKEFTK